MGEKLNEQKKTKKVVIKNLLFQKLVISYLSGTEYRQVTLLPKERKEAQFSEFLVKKLEDLRCSYKIEYEIQ